MRINKMLAALAATLMVGTSLPALAQEPVKVDVSVPASHTVWYADPFWIAIGAAAVLLIIVLAVAASKSGEAKTTTTVIR